MLPGEKSAGIFKDSKTMANHLGEMIKSLRTEKNLSQQQKAEMLFVSRSSVANWETGGRTPDLPMLTRVARLLEVDISMLIDATGVNEDPAEVIVVDDEPHLLSGAIPVLSKTMPKATITGFLKAQEAIDHACQKHISIAFLDIELGKVNGISLCNTLTEINPMMNVIFLTGYPEYAIKAWNTRASGFLIKPLQAEDVMEQLKKLRYPVRGLM